jgi:uncharacterized membrane protein
MRARIKKDYFMMPKSPTQPDRPQWRFRWLYPLLIGGSALIIAVFLLWPPVTLLDKAQAIGYAICHQIPARTFHIHDQALPLCARCTGIYLGAIMGLTGLYLLKRWYAINFPPTAILVTLVMFILIMGFDGVNSYLSFFPKVPRLYEPQNWLRLTTGVLHGLAISILIYPVVNGGLWHASYVRPEPVIKSFKQLAPFLLGAILVILFTLAAVYWWPSAWWLYTLSLLSVGGVLLMLGMLMTVLVVTLFRREGTAHTWRDLAGPAIIGLALTLLMIGGMDWVRLTLTRIAHLPF